VGDNSLFGDRDAVRRGSRAPTKGDRGAPPDPRPSHSNDPQRPAEMPVQQVASHQPPMSQREFDEALEAYLCREARLPPSGISGFDMKLTPFWLGQKLPG